MRWLLVLAVLAALSPLAAGAFYVTGDTRDVFVPLETFFRNEMLSGRLPAWSSDAAWGFPVIASAQIGFFYPPLLLTRWLPLPIYLPLNLIGHLLATALGTYLFLKQIGRSNQAALLGALSFALSAFIFQHLTHLNIIFAIAWFPWQLLLASRKDTGDLVRGTQQAAPDELRDASRGRDSFLIDPKKPISNASRNSIWSSDSAWLSLVIAIPFLAGQIQVPLLMALVTSAYFLTYSRHSSVIRKLVSLSAIALLAIGLAAVQLFPTAELAWHSTRGANNDFDIERANQYSWLPYQAPALFFPRFFGIQETYWGKKIELEQGFFIGTIPLILALYALVSTQRTSPGTHFKFFRWLTVITFLLALGSLSPFRLIGLEPSLWFFSGPARWLLFTTFGLSILAAYGWDNFFAKLRWLPWAAGGVISAIIVFNLILFTTNPITWLQPYLPQLQTALPDILAHEPAYYTEKMHSLLTSLRTSSISLLSPYTALPVIILTTAALARNRQRGRQVLLAATAAELILVAATANQLIPWANVFTPPAAVAQLPATVTSRQARLYSLRDFEDTGAFLTNPETRTFDRLNREPYRLLLPLIHTQFNLPGIAWPASLDLSENAKVLHELNQSLQAGNTELAEELNVGAIISTPSNSPSPEGESNLTPTPLLRKERGDKKTSLPSSEGRLGGVNLETLNPKTRASLRLTNGQEISAEYREITPAYIQITTSTDQPSTLIVRDTFFPGWRATLGSDPGSELVISRTGPHGIFRAVSVPAGEHTIDMVYVPRILYVGLITSLTTATILGFTVFFLRRKLTT